MLYGILGVDYLYEGISLQGSPVFLVSMISSIVIALRKGNIKNIYPVFFIIGAITCFIDFLTSPILTMGLPLTTYFLCMQKERHITFKETIKIIALASINWIMGYALIWFSKWAIVDIFLGKNLIATSIGQLFFRSNIATYTYYEVLDRNIIIIKENIIAMIFLSLIITFIRLYLNRKNLKSWVKVIEKALPYVIILLMPFAWYFAVRGHSYEHAFFTYRDLLILLTCIPIVLLKLSEKDN